MYKLTNPADFDNAILFQNPIEVCLNGELVGQGIIKYHTELSVAIDQDVYLKENCEFRQP
jgi:hypothetical protein